MTDPIDPDPLGEGASEGGLNPDPVDQQLAQAVTLQHPQTGYQVTTSVDTEKYNLLAQGWLDVTDGPALEWLAKPQPEPEPVGKTLADTSVAVDAPVKAPTKRAPRSQSAS